MAKKRDKLIINVKSNLFTYSRIDPNCTLEKVLEQQSGRANYLISKKSKQDKAATTTSCGLILRYLM